MKIKLIKNRSDIGGGARGAHMGIDAMEIAAINANNDFFNRVPFIDIDTDNKAIYYKVNSFFAKRICYVVKQCGRVCQNVHQSLRNGNFPLVLSGDHSSALGTISGIKAADPHARLGIIWIDAHADLHSPYTSLSGNIHGMPLAAALNFNNTDLPDRYKNSPQEETLKHWNSLKQLGTKAAKFLPEDLLYFGVRDTEEAEDIIIKNKEIKNYSVPEIRHRGIQECLREAIEQLKTCDAIYITFDVDSLDCDFVSRGTGTPVSFGFSPEEAKNIITGFLDTNKVVCIEFAEINPLLDDKRNKMAEIAFEILDYCFGKYIT